MNTKRTNVQKSHSLSLAKRHWAKRTKPKRNICQGLTHFTLGWMNALQLQGNGNIQHYMAVSSLVLFCCLIFVSCHRNESQPHERNTSTSSTPRQGYRPLYFGFYILNKYLKIICLHYFEICVRVTRLEFVFGNRFVL